MRKITLALLASTSLLGLASAAIAADMPIRKAPPLPPPPVFSWTGFYIGAHFGSAWGTVESRLTDVTITECFESQCESDSFGTNLPISSHGINGFLGGFQVGWNWQVSPWFVLGVEGQFSWSDIKGSAPCGPLSIITCTTEVDWVTTLAGRVGFAADRALIYIKGGVAWADSNYSATLDLAPLTDFTATTSASDTRTGVMWGAGVEYAFLPNWSAKIEYNYIDFNTETLDFPVALFREGPFSLDLNFDAEIKQHIHLIKFGINYRFGGFGKGPVGKGPVVASY